MKENVQKFGRFLSGMVMPNIGAFIAWGLIAALFIEAGWFPNATIAQMVSPMMFLASMVFPSKRMVTSLSYLAISATRSWAGRICSPRGLMTFTRLDTMAHTSFPIHYKYCSRAGGTRGQTAVTWALSRYFWSGRRSVMTWAPSRGRMVAAVTRPNLLESMSI